MSNTFISGMIVKKPREGAPDFIKLNMSFKTEDFIKFLQAHTVNGWMNVDLKKSKEGKLYCALNEYKKKEETKDLPEINIEEEIKAEDIPF